MRYGDAIEVGGMSDGRDPAVKLFGRKIPLPEEKPLAGNEFGADLAPAAVPLTKGKEDKIKDIANTERELSQLELHSCSGLSICIEDEKKGSTDIAKETEDLKPKLDYKEAAAAAEDKILRKPDKVLQCPRCNSMDTKFCYYNNYNVNQPRYFCKSCQRYWTSGGTMRHVPVGAGRRKNKHSVLSHPHTVQADAPDLIHHQAPSCGSSATMPPLKFNGTVLKFGPDTDTPHCELTTSVLSIEGQKKAEESSCSSSVTAAKYAENDLANESEQKSFLEHQTGVTPLHNSQCFLVPPWAFAWNPGWNNDASMSWCQPQLATAPAFCAPIPFAFAPASFVGWVPSWMSCPWSMPLIGNSNGLVSQSSSTSASNCSGNGSPTLGKHCRDANSSMGEEGKLEKSLWVPKTLRIDDIDEAAKSSIFSILGIKPNEEGLFRTFSSNHKKGEGALSANPAALSRSQAFQETAAT